MAAYFVFLSPILVSVTEFFLKDANEFNEYDIYGYTVTNYSLILTIKAVRKVFEGLAFSVCHLTALLYYMLCGAICCRINNLQKTILNVSAENFKRPIQITVIEQQKDIFTFLKQMEDTFSVSIFLAISSYFWLCFFCTGFLTVIDMSLKETFFKFQYIFMFFSNFVPLVLVTWQAAQVSIELDALKEDISEKMDARYLRGLKSETEIDRSLFEKPSVVLSGLGIIHFSRSLILGILGTLITYALLMINV
ncbi:gustatory receptor for sugar taste 64f-like [Parasteatoda tepidariorum]|uniref:gustatory receptor for sugar taste 64f-like n=1 Tax=Parasteatoda tepidariorum TaxID=114398 RepID=UPI0039BD1874